MATATRPSHPDTNAHGKIKHLRPILELGYVFDGIDGAGHYRLYHPQAGALSVAATPGDWRTMRNTIANAKRKILYGKNVGEQFIDWIIALYGIQDDECREVELAYGNLTETILAFIADQDVRGRGGIPPKPAAILAAINLSGRIVSATDAPGKKGRKTSKQYRIMGRGYYNAHELEHASGSISRRSSTTKRGHEHKNGTNSQPPLLELPNPSAAGLTLVASMATSPEPKTPIIELAERIQPAYKTERNGHAHPISPADKQDFQRLLRDLSSALEPTLKDERALMRETLEKAYLAVSTANDALEDAKRELAGLLELVGTQT